ncbi:MAG: LbtU family siderophore porin [Gammaproteobacteria bacterium]|nr:LbtU family siderophore porin [Gammaproteobacteria bacterium]
MCRPASRQAAGLVLAASLGMPAPAPASEENSVRLYRTREEQREAGLARQLAPWLTASSLFEAEGSKQRISVDDARHVSRSESTASLQLGLAATPLESLKAELVLEYDTDVDKLRADEYIVAVQLGDWELAVGKQYLPLGEYFSRFVSGPILEFGETRDTAATLAYDFSDRLDASVSLYQGVAREVDSTGSDLDWTFALEAWPRADLSFGISFQTDLADSDERLLADQDNRFVRKVPGLSGYLLWIGEHVEVTFEALAATRSFREFESDRDQPSAWNLELALFVHPKVDLALRIEGSRELEDAPRTQFGAAATFLLHRNATLTLELLHARFDGDLAADDDDNPFSHSNRIGALLSVAF